MSELERARRRIRALRQLTVERGATEGEAAAAARLAGELEARHGEAGQAPPAPPSFTVWVDPETLEVHNLATMSDQLLAKAVRAETNRLVDLTMMMMFKRWHDEAREQRAALFALLCALKCEVAKREKDRSRSAD